MQKDEIEKQTPKSENHHDMSGATSCTRAAITALVFGSLAIALLQPLTRARSFES